MQSIKIFSLSQSKNIRLSEHFSGAEVYLDDLVAQPPHDLSRLSKGLVTFAPNVCHWHGASKERKMSHIAIQEVVNGLSVEWFGVVSDDEYLS